VHTVAFNYAGARAGRRASICVPVVPRITSLSSAREPIAAAWYDNEWGYSTRLVELAQRVLVPAPVTV
jgi:hypothetical protein